MDLESFFAAQLGPVLDAVGAPVDGNHPFLVPIPDPNSIDHPLEELASLVARTSNAYQQIARFAGIARAQAKLAKGRYERAFKQSRTGRNDAERQANAMAFAATAHEEMTHAEAVAEIADAFEVGARIASESARKLYDKGVAMAYGAMREERGSYRDSDFASAPY